MSITFKPYAKFGLGSSVRLLRYEFDNERKLRIVGLTGVQETIPLEGAYAKRSDLANALANIAAKMNDMGDVLIVTQGGRKIVCSNINGVQAFISAVEGTHADVQPIPAWDAGLKERPWIVGVVALPTALHDVIALGAPDLRLQWKVSVGQMVKEGEVVAEYNAPPVKGYDKGIVLHAKVKPEIVMPHDGKIVAINHHLTHSDWRLTPSTPVGYGQRPVSPDEILFKFQYYASDTRYGQLLHPTEPKAPGMNLKANSHPYSRMLEFAEMAAATHSKAGRTRESSQAMWENTHPFKIAWAALYSNSKRVEHVENGTVDYVV